MLEKNDLHHRETEPSDGSQQGSLKGKYVGQLRRFHRAEVADE